jgi:hypothetical protein
LCLKANPAGEVIAALAGSDIGFDLASTGEIDRCLALGIRDLGEQTGGAGSLRVRGGQHHAAIGDHRRIPANPPNGLMRTVGAHALSWMKRSIFR